MLEVNISFKTVLLGMHSICLVWQLEHFVDILDYLTSLFVACRSAREAEVLENKARDQGEVLPTEKRFDSNCITPGIAYTCRTIQIIGF